MKAFNFLLLIFAIHIKHSCATRPGLSSSKQLSKSISHGLSETRYSSYAPPSTLHRTLESSPSVSDLELPTLSSYPIPSPSPSSYPALSSSSSSNPTLPPSPKPQATPFASPSTFPLPAASAVPPGDVDGGDGAVGGDGTFLGFVGSENLAFKEKCLSCCRRFPRRRSRSPSYRKIRCHSCWLSMKALNKPIHRNAKCQPGHFLGFSSSPTSCFFRRCQQALRKHPWRRNCKCNKNSYKYD